VICSLLDANQPWRVTIDGQHHRVGKKVNGTLVESFVYEDDLRRVGWYDRTGTLKAQFFFDIEGQSPAYMIKGGQNYKFVRDQIGSVREVIASDGSVAERLDLDEFGNVLGDSAPGFQPFGFAGGLHDQDSGLTRFGTRDYDATTGRWTAPDSTRFGGGLSNLYSYVGAAPIGKADPTGKGPVGIVAWAACTAYDSYSTISDFTDLAIFEDEVLKIGEQLRVLRERCTTPPLFCSPEDAERMDKLYKLFLNKSLQYASDKYAAFRNTIVTSCVCTGLFGVAFGTPF